MGALISFYFKKETLAAMIEIAEKKGQKGIGLTMSVNDKADEYGNNADIFVSQTKEEREARANKFFTGKGKVVWVGESGISKPNFSSNNGYQQQGNTFVHHAGQQPQPQPQQHQNYKDDDGLPF